MNLLKRLPPFDSKSGNLNVVIDTPKGCRSKFAFDMKRKAYVLKSILPHGTVFPFDFGSIPGTVADDGDPLDALVLMDEPAFCGCLIESRLVGVIEAEQSEDGKTERNDRLIAVAAKSQTHAEVKSLSDLSPALLKGDRTLFHLRPPGPRTKIPTDWATRAERGGAVGKKTKTPRYASQINLDDGAFCGRPRAPSQRGDQGAAEDGEGC